MAKDRRQPSDTVVYDRNGNLVRVIPARKVSFPSEAKRANLANLAKLREMQGKK
jgi:hypothetical protein